MKTIYKYQVKEDVDLPVGAEILSVNFQDGVPFIWALVDPDANTEIRHFASIGTGGLIHRSRIKKFIGTAFEGNSGPAIHVFEIAK